MTTGIILVLAMLIILNLWLVWGNIREAKRNEQKLQDRLDEFNKATELHQKELQGARRRVDEAMSTLAQVRKNYDKLLNEHESLYREYNSLKKAQNVEPTSHCGCDAKTESCDKKPKKKPGRPRKKTKKQES